jgi:drug/metabolite transporter (DMT)-like permease
LPTKGSGLLYAQIMALPTKTTRVLAYGAIYIFWGGSFLAIRELVAVTPPFFVAAMRFLLAGLLLYIFASWRGAPRPTGRELRHSIGMALVMFTGNYACLFWAEVRLASGTAAILTAMVPIWILLGEAMVLRTQRWSAAGVAGAALGIAGVALVSESVGFHAGMLAAAGVLLLGTLFFSGATLWSRSLTLPADQMQRASLQMGFGGAGLLVLSAAAGELPRLPAALAAWNGRILLAFLYLLICASIWAFTAYTWLIHHEPAMRVSSYAYVNPLIASVLGVVLAGERISGLQAAGAALVILGVVATLMARQRSVRPAVPERSVATR